MSLMTENLLLQAQSLRLEGEMDAAIDLLRVVISQCNSDLQHIDSSREESHSKTTRQLRQMASYQLALLLLQRSGRKQGCNTTGNVHDDTRNDGYEADQLLWKLGYRLRLSTAAFGYTMCNCTQPNPNMESLPTIIDNALPKLIFDALQHAFRQESRYWSQFYCKANCNQNGTKDEERKANQFASHNIPLPSNINASSSSYSKHVRQSKSLLEQVAIITQHQLQDHFPQIMNATSVEVWSHKRPLDGMHQLHYDMDEISLWKHRKKIVDSFEGDDYASQDYSKQRDSSKRLKTDHCATFRDDGISCPIVSCVIFIDIPNDQLGTCSVCGSTGNSTPTIICNQSIIDRESTNMSNIGYLCFPYPNRLLAFEGSLLHGVIPGIPCSSSIATSDDENESNCSDDSYYPGTQHGSKGLLSCDNNQRITLMMGFWKDVCLSTAKNDGEGEEVGPNLLFRDLSLGSWKEEFTPVSDIDDSFFGKKSEQTLTTHKADIIDPLWVSIRDNNTAQDINDFGVYSSGGDNEDKQSGRFFLESTDPRDIDNKVLNGA